MECVFHLQFNTGIPSVDILTCNQQSITRYIPRCKGGIVKVQCQTDSYASATSPHVQYLKRHRRLQGTVRAVVIFFYPPAQYFRLRTWNQYSGRNMKGPPEEHCIPENILHRLCTFQS